jgi:hypothetical protein
MKARILHFSTSLSEVSCLVGATENVKSQYLKKVIN